ncbi:hypothetical protein GWL_33420 [Herbaspirillum sp. GW103]|nr:hypothetical protein GWL_33420 [Herbaspirillum sp. GW103]
MGHTVRGWRWRRPARHGSRTARQKHYGNRIVPPTGSSARPIHSRLAGLMCFHVLHPSPKTCRLRFPAALALHVRACCTVAL